MYNFRISKYFNAKFPDRTRFYPKIIFDSVISYGKLLCLLPLDSGSPVKFKVLNRVGCFILAANIIGIQLSLLATVYRNLHDKILVTTLLSVSMGYLELFLNILIWRFKRVEFQELLQNFKTFLSTSKSHERIIINNYFNRYKYFYIFQLIFSASTIFVRTVLAPIQQSPKIPFAIYYPFVIEQYSATYYIVYLLQSIVAFYGGFQLLFILNIVMILTHAALKLEILIHDLKTVKNCSQLRIWTQQHLECIRFVDRINVVLGSVIIKSYIVLGLATIFASIKFIYNPNFFVVVRSSVLIICCLFGTYMYNGPADDIYEMHQRIGLTLYNMEWNEELMKMKKTIVIIMSQVQKPIFISPLRGLMPALNKKIYTNFLSYLISYIMTLRAIVNTQ